MAVRKKVFVMLWESHTKLLESVRDRLDVDIETVSLRWQRNDDG